MKYIPYPSLIWIVIIIHSIWLITIFGQMNSIQDLQAITINCPETSYMNCPNAHYNTENIQHPIYTNEYLNIGETITYNPLKATSTNFNISVWLSLIIALLTNIAIYKRLKTTIDAKPIKQEQPIIRKHQIK